MVLPDVAVASAFAPQSVAPTSSNSLCGSWMTTRRNSLGGNLITTSSNSLGGSGMTSVAWGNWWEMGFARRMAPQAPGGVTGLCRGFNIRPAKRGSHQ